MYTVSKQENQYIMTDADGKQVYSGLYARAPKSRRGVLTVTGDGGRFALTEHLTEIAVYRDTEKLFRVCKQPDIRFGRGSAHIYLPERGIFCDGTAREGYTIYTQDAALGSLRPARLDDARFLACDALCGALELLALAFWLLRR